MISKIIYLLLISLVMSCKQSNLNYSPKEQPQIISNKVVDTIVLDSTVINCANFFAFKPLTDEEYLILNYTGVSSNFEINESIKNESFSFYIENRKDCYSMPEGCSDIKVSQITIDGVRKKCKVEVFEYISGKYTVSRKDSVVQCKFDNCEFKSKRKIKRIKNLCFNFKLNYEIPG